MANYILLDYVKVSYEDYEQMREEEVCEAYNDYYCECEYTKQEPISFSEFAKGFKYTV